MSVADLVQDLSHLHNERLPSVQAQLVVLVTEYTHNSNNDSAYKTRTLYTMYITNTTQTADKPLLRSILIFNYSHAHERGGLELRFIILLDKC